MRRDDRRGLRGLCTEWCSGTFMCLSLVPGGSRGLTSAITGAEVDA